MIIKRITLNNFRVFSGVHEIELMPILDKPNNPIILFGGLNGSGKTSILTAVRVALYGRHSIGKSISADEYKEYLNSLIHKGNGSNSSANNCSVEVVFDYNHHGESTEYTVIRGWKHGQTEKIKILENGLEKTELTADHCQGFLNELIPVGVADLFFFDGEKIADLAEDESGVILRTAVQRLLGLDIISRLRNDLSILLKRANVRAMPDNIKSKISKLEKEQSNYESEAELLEHQISISNSNIENIKSDITRSELKLSQEGGAWATSRDNEKSKVDSLFVEKDNLEKTIRAELEASYPLSLAPKSLSLLLTTLEQEAEQKRTKAFQSELDVFLNTVKTQFTTKLNNPSEAQQIIDSIATSVKSKQLEPLVFDISDRELSQLNYQINSAASNSQNKFSTATKRLSEVESLLENSAANIARAPEQEQLQTHLEKIKGLNEKLTIEHLNRQQLIEKGKRAYRNAIDTARKIQKLHDEFRADANITSAIANAETTRQLLGDFSESLKIERIKHLEEAFIDSYKKLARKEDLKLTAVIDPDSFDVVLIDEQGHKVNRKALSAGEKQIYAIAILEALGKASGHKLPIIIDTPLGRLDSKHRNKLIKHYFPNASHQVIILSTDTEVDEQYFDWMKNHISHAYEIEFNEINQASTLKEGYFWQTKLSEAS